MTFLPGVDVAAITSFIARLVESAGVAPVGIVHVGGRGGMRKRQADR